MNYEKFYKMAVKQATPEEEEQFANIGKTYPEKQKNKPNKSTTPENKDTDTTPSQETTTETDKPKESGWKDTVYNKANYNIERVAGYPNHLPMFALLGLTGALGGYAFANKKKRGAGALFGGLSLPALYLAYIASRRNGILPMGGIINKYLDKGINKVNDWGNQYNPWKSDT